MHNKINSLIAYCGMVLSFGVYAETKKLTRDIVNSVGQNCSEVFNTQTKLWNMPEESRRSAKIALSFVANASFKANATYIFRNIKVHLHELKTPLAIVSDDHGISWNILISIEDLQAFGTSHPSHPANTRDLAPIATKEPIKRNKTTNQERAQKDKHFAERAEFLRRWMTKVIDARITYLSSKKRSLEHRESREGILNTTEQDLNLPQISEPTIQSFIDFRTRAMVALQISEDAFAAAFAWHPNRRRFPQKNIDPFWVRFAALAKYYAENPGKLDDTLNDSERKTKVNELWSFLTRKKNISENPSEDTDYRTDLRKIRKHLPSPFAETDQDQLHIQEVINRLGIFRDFATDAAMFNNDLLFVDDNWRYRISGIMPQPVFDLYVGEIHKIIDSL